MTGRVSNRESGHFIRKPIVINIIWNYASFLLNAIVSLFLARYILGQIGSVQYGTWVLIGSLLGYAGLMDFGIGAAVVKQVSSAVARNDWKEIQEIITTATSLFVLVALLALVACVLFSRIDSSFFGVPQHSGPAFSLLILVLGFGMAVSFVGRVHLSILRALERFDVASSITMVQLLFQIVLVFAFLNNSIIVLGIIYACLNISASVSHMIAVKILLPQFSLTRWRFNLPVMHSIGTYGFFAFLVILADRLRFYTDSMVTGHFLGAGAVTLFYFGNRLVEFSRSVVAPIAAPFFPLFGRYEGAGNKDRARTAFLVSSRVIAIISFLICGALLASGLPFLSVWIGDKLDSITPSYYVLLVLAVPSMLDVSQSISVNYLYGTNRHRFLSYLTMSEGIVNLGLSIFLVRIFGIYGVALGTALPMAMTKGICQPAYVCRQIGLSLSLYFNKCFVSPMVFAAIYTGMQVFLLRTFQVDTLFTLFITVALSTLMILPAIYFFYFSREERDSLRQIYQGRSNG